MDSEANQALLQHHEQEEEEEEKLEFQFKTEIKEAILNLKQLKSFEILKSALQIFTSNTKFMFLMILSSLPFFAFMAFYEIKLHKAIEPLSKLLAQPFYYYCDFDFGSFTYNNCSHQMKKFLGILLQLCPFYLIMYPLLELFSLIIIIKLAAKTYVGEKYSTLKETMNDVFSYQKNNFKGPLITSFWVHLLSTSTLVGLFWIVANHYIIFEGFRNYYYYYNTPMETCVKFLSLGFHAVIFAALLYKYLDWSALWNMGMVISVLEEETGIEALEMSGYYGKRCKRTGFQLMLVFFVYGGVLRLFCFICVGMFKESSVGEGLITVFVIGLVCLGNLVKWVALVLYFYDCKAQTLQKKVDEEVEKV